MKGKDEMVELRERYLNGNRLIKRESLMDCARCTDSTGKRR